MLMMRLTRVGRKNNPSFRLVVVEKQRAAKKGPHIDLLGSYSPRSNVAQIDADKIKKWIAQGVQPSDTVHNLLIREGIIEGKKRNVLPKKTAPVKEVAEEAPKPAEIEAAPAEEPVPAEETPVPEVPAEAPEENPEA